MKNRENKFLILMVLLWILVIGGSVWLNIAQTVRSDRDKNLEAARSLFDIIVTTREWNARMGGVYVPVSKDIQPNPYLDTPDRDISSTNGLSLTKINPAYMTRLVGEIAEANNNVKFHITSLKPIRPANAPVPWEKEALTLFEGQGQGEYFFWSADAREFNYMAPLFVDESCMPCHAQQGYEVGDIRGGISVSFPVQPVVTWPILGSYLIVGAIGLTLILVPGLRLTDAFRKLEQQTEIDGLTQVNNRYYFDQYFHREFLRARRVNSPLSIIICDIDDFKAFNDNYGHQLGDTCLKSVAQALQQVMQRPGDVVARYGGEEFGIILPDTNEEGALTIAELLRARVESLRIPHHANRASKYITISLGVATYLGGEPTLENLLEQSDQALYQAKSKGRNIVVSANCHMAPG